MIIKKLVLLSSVALMSLGVTACQNQTSSVQSTNSSQENQSSVSNLKSTDQSSNKNLNSKDRSFSNNEWMLMGYLFYKNKDVNNLQSTIQNTSNDFNNGNLIAHKNSDNSYTLSNQYGSVDVKVENSEVIVTNDGTTISSKGELVKLFTGKEEDIKKMVKYVKDSSSSQNSEADNVQTDTKNKSENSTKGTKTNLPGDEGLYPIPTQYQGTWYSYVEGKEEKITFTGSKIITDSTPTELHKVDTERLPATPSESQIAAGAQYGRVSLVTINGIKYLNIKGYFQVNGFGTYYGYHTEKGHPVIILSLGNSASGFNSVYWKSPELAKQYEDEKFDDLN